MQSFPLFKIHNTNVLKLKLQFYHDLEEKTSCISVSQYNKKTLVVLLNTSITFPSNDFHILSKESKELKYILKKPFSRELVKLP